MFTACHPTELEPQGPARRSRRSVTPRPRFLRSRWRRRIGCQGQSPQPLRGNERRCATRAIPPAPREEASGRRSIVGSRAPSSSRAPGFSGFHQHRVEPSLEMLSTARKETVASARPARAARSRGIQVHVNEARGQTASFDGVQGAADQAAAADLGPGEGGAITSSTVAPVCARRARRARPRVRPDHDDVQIPLTVTSDARHEPPAAGPMCGQLVRPQPRAGGQLLGFLAREGRVHRAQAVHVHDRRAREKPCAQPGQEQTHAAAIRGRDDHERLRRGVQRAQQPHRLFLLQVMNEQRADHDS